MYPRLIVCALLVFCAISITESARTLKKPLCDMCENLVKTIDDVLAKGGDVEEAVDNFCKQDVPPILFDFCEKTILKNLKDIIAKLKDHESPEKICTDIYLCAA